MAWPYVTGAQLADYCRNEIPGDADFYAARALAASRAITKYAGRVFHRPSGTLVRQYGRDDNDETLVYVDDLDPTGAVVTEDGDTVPTSVLQWEPTNRVDFTGRTVPAIRVRRTDRAWLADGNRLIVAVTSNTWGWSATPDEVTEATLILGKDLVHMRDNRFGVAGYDSEMGLVRIRQNPLIPQLIGEDLCRPETREVGAWILT